jgi:uncharacterized membrane protein
LIRQREPDREKDMLHGLSLTIGAAGVAVIVWGVVLGLFGLVKLEFYRFKGAADLEQRESLRHDLAYYLLLGLEFLVAADIVHTILTPTLDELAVLGAIVAIRTVISFSLNWELRQGHGKPDELPTH